MAQTGGADVVIVKTFEVSGVTRIAISHGEGKTEIVEAPGGGSKKDLTDSSEALHKVITGLYRQGYALKNTFGGNQGSGSTLIFVKGQ